MGLTQTQEYYLQTMGVDVYWSRDRVLVEPVNDEIKTTDDPVLNTSIPESSEWEALRDSVASCQQCELHRGRTQTVFGVGDHQANWLILGSQSHNRISIHPPGIRLEF